MSDIKAKIKDQDGRRPCSHTTDCKMLEASQKEKCVRLCEHHDGGKKEKCDNRSEGEGRVEVLEMFGG